MNGLNDDLELEVVLNGWVYKIPAAPTSTLDQVIADALAIGNHTGRPARDWEIRDVAGVLLNECSQRTLTDLNLHRGGPDTRLYVNLRAGVGA
jgi:hypothetical protein